MRDQLTQSDIDKMQQEIEYRKLVKRPELLEAVKETRAHGDLSENFEYHAAKKEKNKNESRIRYLERMIKTAQVISDDSKTDEVGMNNTVTVYVEEDDCDSLENLISIESPMGKALMRHKVGDRVEIRVSDNYSYFVVIRKIDKTNDDSEDKIRSY